MFRIQENNDGTTSIFCKDSGRLVCSIPTKGSTRQHRRPVNVVEPQLVNETPSGDSWLESKPKKDEPDQEENDKASSTSSVSLFSLPLPKDEDYRLEDASQGQFAKCLGLVSQEELHQRPLTELLAEWPLRLLSKSSAFRTSESALLKDIKVPDQLPITSSLGVRLLRLNMPRNFASPERVSQALRSYESFCRHPYNTACPSACHFPKLRCRGEKAYPVSTPSRVTRHLQVAHVYTWGRRQREERKRTLRTGLDAKSRRLLRRCNSRQLTVDIVRLPQHEIDDWLSRVTTINIVDTDDEMDSEPECYIPRPRLAPRRGLTCSVRLRNIVVDIQRRYDGHFVRNTNIKVPFYRDFLSTLAANRPLFNAVYMANGDGPRTKPLQRHKPHPKGRQQSLNPKLKLPPAKPQQRLKPPPTTQMFVSLPVKLEAPSKAKALSVSNKPILCIDLTEEITPPRKSPAPMNSRLVNSGQKVVVISGQPVGANSSLQVGVNREQKVIVNIGPKVSVSSGRQVFANSKQPKLVGYGSSQVSANGGKSNGSKHSVGTETNQRPMIVNGRNLVSNDRLVVVNSGPSSSRVRAVAEERSTIANRRSSQAVANHSGEGQVVSSRGGRKPSVFKVATGRPLVPNTSRFVVSQYKFHCFACGLQRNYKEQADSGAVEREVRKHLTTYHATSNAESFLSRYLDSVNHCAVIEAFPGYKED